jgi:hypothetical protein
MNPKYTLRLGVAAGTLALILAAAPHAQPTGGKILADITINGTKTCRTAQIGFSFPVRYINHFPQSEGKEVRIQLKPLTVGPLEEQDLSDREAFSPAEDEVLLNNVIYEGDMQGGPYLTVQFSQAVQFTVAQGTDFRSVNVSFHAAGDTCPTTASSAPQPLACEFPSQSSCRS